jgi:hypothetical protein
MARSFNGTTDKMQIAGGIAVTLTLFSIASMAKPTAVTANMVVTATSRTTAPFTDDASLAVAGAVANDPATLLVSDSGVNRPVSATSTSCVAGVWQPISASNASATSHIAYLNGGGEVANTTSCSPPALVQTTQVGCRNEAGADVSFFGGDICEVAWWSVALSARQQAGIGAGGCALLASMSLKAYWPLWPGNTGTEVGLIRGTALTATGTGSARHGPVFARHAGGV